GKIPAHTGKTSTSLFIFNLQDSKKCFLRYLDVANLLHTFLPSLLLFKQFLLSADVATVAFCQHILAQGLHVLSGDDLGTDGRLDGNIEHLPGNQATHARNHFPAPVACIRSVNNHGKCVHTIAVDQQVDLDYVRVTELQELVIHGGIAAGNRFKAIEEIQHDFGERHFVCELHLPTVVDHVHLYATLCVAQGHYRAHVILRHE